LLGRFLRLQAVVEDDERRTLVTELLRDAPPHATEPADDVVLPQRLDRHSPPSLRPQPADHTARDRLDDERADVGKDTDARQNQKDRDDPSPVILRNRVESGERARDDRAVEGLEPGLPDRRVKADGADAEHHEHRGDCVGKTSEAEGMVHLRSIVGSWTTTPRSASSTSISTLSRW